MFESRLKSYYNNHNDLAVASCIVLPIIFGFVSFVMLLTQLLVNCNFDIDYKYLCVFGANIIGHMVIDDLKCNRYKINLITDQFLHMIQIILSWIIL